MTKLQDTSQEELNGHLLRAARLGTDDMAVEFCRELVTDVGADVNARDPQGHTALMWAAQNGHVNMISTLITLGADINAQNNSGNTALMLASAPQGGLGVRELLVAGADINAQNKSGCTALMYAVGSTRSEALSVLLDHSPNLLLKSDKGVTAKDLLLSVDTPDSDAEKRLCDMTTEQEFRAAADKGTKKGRRIYRKIPGRGPTHG